MNRGFIGTIIVIIIGLALLKYFFDWSIFEALGTPSGQETVAYIKAILIWIKEAIISLWNYIS